MALEPGYASKYKTTYSSWSNMWKRINQKVSVGRYVGVTAEHRWLDFECFLNDMGERPEGKTLDRIDSTKGYSKDNCKWSTLEEQAANRKNVLLVGDGEDVLPLKKMCLKHNKPYKSVFARLSLGWSIAEAMGTPIQKGSNQTTITRNADGRFYVDKASDNFCRFRDS